MHSVGIDHAGHPLYRPFLRVYEASFPANERRSPAAQDAAFADSRYRLDAWLRRTVFIGFMGWWDFGGFRYVEHVAVAPEARSGGHGKLILETWMRASPTPVRLEIEEVVDDVTRRRLAFYERLGFVGNSGVHIQPPYQGGGDGVRMQALSWPEALGREQHKRFIALLHSEVWAHLSA